MARKSSTGRGTSSKARAAADSAPAPPARAAWDVPRQQDSAALTQEQIDSVISRIGAEIAGIENGDSVSANGEGPPGWGRCYAIAGEFRTVPLLWQQQVDRIHERMRALALRG